MVLQVDPDPHGVGGHHAEVKVLESRLDLTKIFYPNMWYSNTMGFRVTMGDHMCLWAVGQD